MDTIKRNYYLSPEIKVDVIYLEESLASSSATISNQATTDAPRIEEWDASTPAKSKQFEL